MRSPADKAAACAEASQVQVLKAYYDDLHRKLATGEALMKPSAEEASATVKTSSVEQATAIIKAGPGKPWAVDESMLNSKLPECPTSTSTPEPAFLLPPGLPPDFYAYFNKLRICNPDKTAIGCAGWTLRQALNKNGPSTPEPMDHTGWDAVHSLTLSLNAANVFFA